MIILKFIAINTSGSCFLIIDDEKRIMVDCGHKAPGGTTKNVLEYLKPFDYTLDLFIATHFDDDHVQGLNELAKSKKIKVKELWIPDAVKKVNEKGQAEIPECFYNIAEKMVCIKGHDMDAQYYTHNKDEITEEVFDVDENFKIAVLNGIPDSSGHTESLSSNNETCLVFYYCGETGILLTGDSDLADIAKNANPNVKATIKEKTTLATIPHHGSADLKHLFKLVDDDITFVRSHFNLAKKFREYNELDTVYCTHCIVNKEIDGKIKPSREEYSSQIIELTYVEGEWIATNEAYKCKCELDIKK